MAKKIEVSNRDAAAAAAALKQLEQLDGLRCEHWGEELRDRLQSCRALLQKAAPPRVSKPLRVH